MPLFSIIIPVYKVEKYLNQCVNSVLNQNFDDFEVILINDGSPDNCPSICDKYALLDNRVKVIHKENGGLSSARNAGISSSTGKYIIFLDSDDYWNPYKLIDVAEACTNYDVDLILFDYCCIDELNENRVRPSSHNYQDVAGKIFSADQLLKKILIMNNLYNWYPVMYAIKRDIIVQNNLYFAEGNVYEDVYLIPRIFMKCSDALVCDTNLYCYRINREGSICSTIKLKTEIDKLHVAVKNLEWINKTINDNELKKLLANNFSIFWYSSLILAYYFKKDERNLLFNKLKETSWICQYTFSKPQMYVTKLIKIFGIRKVSLLLFLRSKLRLKGAN